MVYWVIWKVLDHLLFVELNYFHVTLLLFHWIGILFGGFFFFIYLLLFDFYFLCFVPIFYFSIDEILFVGLFFRFSLNTFKFETVLICFYLNIILFYFFFFFLDFFFQKNFISWNDITFVKSLLKNIEIHFKMFESVLCVL